MQNSSGDTSKPKRPGAKAVREMAEKIVALEGELAQLKQPPMTYKKMQARVRFLTDANHRLLDDLQRLQVELSALRFTTSRLRDAIPASAEAAIAPEMLARLVRLCHPDKHSNSAASNEATAWLLGRRPNRLKHNP